MGKKEREPVFRPEPPRTIVGKGRSRRLQTKGDEPPPNLVSQLAGLVGRPDAERETIEESIRALLWKTSGSVRRLAWYTELASIEDRLAVVGELRDLTAAAGRLAARWADQFHRVDPNGVIPPKKVERFARAALELARELELQAPVIGDRVAEEGRKLGVVWKVVESASDAFDDLGGRVEGNRPRFVVEVAKFAGLTVDREDVLATLETIAAADEVARLADEEARRPIGGDDD